MHHPKTALITGGARGIGRGIAEALAADGWRLMLCGTRAAEDVEDVVREIAEKHDAAVKYYRCDVSVAAEREKLVEAVYETCGNLNLLVNNAGVGAKVRGDMLDMTPENYAWLMGINLEGPFFLTQAVARRMIRMKQDHPALTGPPPAEGNYPDTSACVVNISSISAVAATVHRGEYCISKAGLSMATKLWSVRLAEHGIPVYEIRPGIIRTDMTAGVTAKYDRLISEGLTLQRRWGLPEDVGRAVRMLARGDLSYSTGQVILVDGGMMVERL